MKATIENRAETAMAYSNHCSGVLQPLQRRVATTAKACSNHCSGCSEPLQMMGCATADDGEHHCKGCSFIGMMAEGATCGGCFPLRIKSLWQWMGGGTVVARGG